jgi:hypothetical protein
MKIIITGIIAAFVIFLLVSLRVYEGYLVHDYEGLFYTEELKCHMDDLVPLSAVWKVSNANFQLDEEDLEKKINRYQRSSREGSKVGLLAKALVVVLKHPVKKSVFILFKFYRNLDVNCDDQYQLQQY